MVSRILGMALFLAAVLVSTWPGEYAGVRRAFCEGGSNSASAEIHEVTSPDMLGFRMTISGSAIDVNFAPGALETPLSAVHRWIAASACAVTTYYGRFPVKHLHLLIVPVEGETGVLSGRTEGYGGASTKIFVGQLATEEDLMRDWVITHEMVHLAFPSVAEEHHWIEEGIATYVEPIARVEAGNLEPRNVWHDLVEGLPRGLPQARDQGLDRTHTWGRTYWGGALFCTLADVRIRQRTSNRYGLQDALRAILAAGGSMETSWPLERALMVGDTATGVSVLTELYQQMKAKAVQCDLAGLWNKLGVEPLGGVSFNDRAPLAAVRRAITAIPAGTTSCCPAFDDSAAPLNRTNFANMRTIFEFSAENAKSADWLAEGSEFEPPVPLSKLPDDSITSSRGASKMPCAATSAPRRRDWANSADLRMTARRHQRGGIES